MNISSVVLTHRSHENLTESHTATDASDDLCVLSSIDTASLDILKLGLTRDVPQIDISNLQGVQWVSYEKSPIERSLSYSLGSGLSCDVTRHELRDHEVGYSDKLVEGHAIALKRIISTQEENTRPTKGHLVRVLQFLRQELDVFCHPVLGKHPNIARLEVIAWERNSLIPLLGLELASFGTLDDFLSSANLTKTKHTITSWELRRATADITHGLEALHACGFAHGDLKPGNILVQCHQKLLLCCKLADFSGARPLANKIPSSTYECHGTPAWMPPERLSGEVVIDWALADVYSYGLLIITLLRKQSATPGLPVECFLAHHIKSRGERASDGMVSTFNGLKLLEDDNLTSPMNLALSEYADHMSYGLVFVISRHCLSKYPTRRSDMSTILKALGSQPYTMFDIDEPM